MEIIKIVKVALTEEEKEILQKAQNILSDFETESSALLISMLQDKYEDYVPFKNCAALATAIDLIDVILNDNLYEEGKEDEN